MRVRATITFGMLVCCVVATACAIPWRAPEPTKPEAMSRWLYHVQGYVPVFPPREDVQIGDVHLYTEDPDSGRLVALYEMPRWSALSASELLEATGRKRGEHPETPASYLRSGIQPQNRDWPEALAPAGAEGEEAGTRRLRSIQLPPFSVERTDAAELPPAFSMMLAVDDSQLDWSSIRIGIESAETSALALEDAIATFLERRGSRIYLPPALRQNLRALVSRDLDKVWLRVVTEVVYMRALRLTIVSEPELFEIGSKETSSAGLGYEDDGYEAAAAEVELDETYAAIARAHAMNQKLIDSGSDVPPDSFIRFLRVSDGLTTARRVFRRPTAIGVGGLSLEVDVRTGEVEAFRLMGRRLHVRRGLAGDDDSDTIDAEPATPTDDERPAPGGETPGRRRVILASALGFSVEQREFRFDE